MTGPDRGATSTPRTGPPRGDQHGATPVEAAGAALASTLAVVVSVWWKVTHSALPEAYTRAGYSDIAALFSARGLDAGLPWRDVPLEYPPGIGLLAWGAATVSDDPRTFLVVTGMVLAVAAAIATWLLAREVGWPRPVAVLAGPIVVMAAAINWDLVPVALAVGGLVAHRHGRDATAGALLGVGVATKLWPALLLLAIVPAAWRMRGRRAGLATMGAAAIGWLVLNLPVMALSFDGWRLFLDLNRERVADWDSLWRLLGLRAGVDPAVPTLNVWVAVLTVAGVAAVLAATLRRFPAERWHESGFALVAVFLLVGKVWSPQFTLWLLPLVVLAWPGWGWVTALAVTDVAVHVTRFSWLAAFVDGGLAGAWPEWPFLVAVLLRDTVVVAIAVAWWRRAGRDVADVDGRLATT